MSEQLMVAGTKVHLIGIGGAGMSALAEVLFGLGLSVSGSDVQRSKVTDRLARAGIVVAIGHQAEHVNDPDVVVISSAIQANNVELQAAQARGIMVLHRAECIALLMQRYPKTIAIAGSHGKTTTTAMISEIMVHAGLDPTVLCGGELQLEGKNGRVGQSEYLVLEADESDASFLKWSPRLAVVTNVDPDHMTTYHHDISEFENSFKTFLAHSGVGIFWGDDPRLQSILTQAVSAGETYGFEPHNTWQARGVSIHAGRQWVEVWYKGQSLGELSLPLPGRYNVLNALAALAVTHKLGVRFECACAALADFKGVKRRTQVFGPVAWGEEGEISLVDDYAHHPREIASVLAAFAELWPNRRKLVFFQPHRYTRTQDLMAEFVAVLAPLSHLFLFDIYAAGEAVIEGVSSKVLADNINQSQGHAQLLGSFAEGLAVLETMVRPNDVVMVIGAGSIGLFAEQAGQELQAQATLKERDTVWG